MAIISKYKDMRMFIDNLSEDAIRSMLTDREFAVIKIDMSGYEYDPAHRRNGVYFDDYTLQIEDNNAKERTYLHIKTKETPFVQSSPKLKSREGVRILFPTIDEMIPMLLGKRLIFSASFIEDIGVESVLDHKLQEFVFNLRKTDEHYLYDNFFDVKVFLQKVSDGSPAEQAFLKPVDIRDFDIHPKMLSKLKKESGGYYNDTLIFTYAALSDQLQAQYFLTKFHSNRAWNLDPVCILNFRMSAFIVPRIVKEAESADVPKERITRDCISASKYVIDSIYVNTDICFDMKEFNALIEEFYTCIALA